MLYILALPAKSILLLYVSSILLGIAASFLWTGQVSYLIRVSGARSYGTNAGFFISILSIGSAIGILFAQLLINSFSFSIFFIIASVFPLIAFAFLFFLKDVRVERTVNRLQLLLTTMSSKTAFRLSAIWFSFHFIVGLGIGIIPLEIKNTLGFSYIGLLSSVRWIIPIVLAYFIGRFSDTYGRKKMIIFSFAVALFGYIAFYFSQSPFFLILGIVLFALAISLKAVALGLLGDVTSETNLEFITGFLLIAENLGLLTAVILSTIIQTKIVYLVSMAILLALFAILFPVIKLPKYRIKDKLTSEVYGK